MAKTKKYRQQKYPFILLGIIIVIGISGFFLLKKQTTPHYPQTLAETYAGELPCADCSGIRTTLMFTKNSGTNQQGTYVQNALYEGKTTTPIITTGKWDITQGTPNDPNAFVLTVTQNNSSENTYYLIEEGKLTMLDQKKEKINAPFNESLAAASTKNAAQLTETQTKIISQLHLWMPTAIWSDPAASQEKTYYGDVLGSEVTGTLKTQEATVPHFENPELLNSLGFSPDTNLSADGPGSSEWGYTKETNGERQFILFSYQTEPTSTDPNEPLQFNCPCQTKLTVFVSN